MKYLLTILTVGLLSPVFSQGFTADNLSFYLDKNFLGNYTGQDYNWKDYLGIAELELRTDKSFTARYNAKGYYWSCSGSWQMNDGVISLSPAVCFDNDGGDDCNKACGAATVELVKDNSSLVYAEFLQVTSENHEDILGNGEGGKVFRVGVDGKPVPEGAKRTYNDVDILMMGYKEGKTTTGVYIREKPSTKGTKLVYKTDPEEKGNDFVPKGSSVVVIGRTMGKDKVDDHDNYWYLVNVGINYRVWMFGEYVKF